MSWHPNDLVTDADLLAYERTIVSQFNVTDWQSRRQKALEDWLFPLLEGRGFSPQRLRTRADATAVFSYTSSTFTDRTAASITEDGLSLATILAASGDHLYVGSADPFRGLSVRVTDAPSSAASTLTLQVWTDNWIAPEDIRNATVITGKPFARGGAITWTLPEDTVRRSVNSSAPLYWARLALSTAPTGCSIGPMAVIRRSRLCAAVTFRTLALIFREAPAAQEGPWQEKAVWYEAEAERAWLRVADLIGGEFDTDNSDQISAEEAAQTAAEANGGGWTLERC